jgi:exopolysaccharide biosynthesis predicted pyruvyltransferase EpsI
MSKPITDPGDTAVAVTVPGRPDFASLKQYLSELMDSRQQIMYYPNQGNAGDMVIDAAFFVLAQHIGLTFTRLEEPRVPPGSDVVLYGGGGSLVTYWNKTRDFIKQNLYNCKLFVILPHTIDGHKDLLENLPPHIHIWARETVSYEYLKAVVPYPEHVFISHDLAFYLEELRFETSNNDRFRQMLPKKRKVAFRLDEEKHLERDFLPSCNDDLSRTCGGDESDVVKVVDVVRKLFRHINTTDIVYTDRLHVGIVAAILRKEVHFFPGSYYKINAVYEHSMRSFYPNVLLHADFSVLKKLKCEYPKEEPCQQPFEDNRW